MSEIYAVFALGPLAYFENLDNALAYWSYVQHGDGINPSPCELLGIHKDDVQLYTITPYDRDNQDGMEWIHEVNRKRLETRKDRV